MRYTIWRHNVKKNLHQFNGTAIIAGEHAPYVQPFVCYRDKSMCSYVIVCLFAHLLY